MFLFCLFFSILWEQTAHMEQDSPLLFQSQSLLGSTTIPRPWAEGSNPWQHRLWQRLRLSDSNLSAGPWGSHTKLQPPTWIPSPADHILPFICHSFVLVLFHSEQGGVKGMLSFSFLQTPSPIVRTKTIVRNTCRYQSNTMRHPCKHWNQQAMFVPFQLKTSPKRLISFIFYSFNRN